MPHQTYFIKDIAKLVRGELLQNENEKPVENLLLDSRKLIYPEQSLFFAIKGKRNDGHQYLKEVHEKGVQNFIVQELPEGLVLPGANILKVKNSVVALQQLSAHHRNQYKIPVIGITGSNGKTIVKEWLNQLLERDYFIARSPKSYNSQIGVPLSVWLLNQHHSLGIFEAGISEPGEMDAIEKIIRPTIGIFTNIGPAHSESFLNLRHKTKEKLKLFVNTDVLIYCSDYKDINQSIAEINQSNKKDGEIEQKFKLFTWSTGPDADVHITKIQKGEKETIIEVAYKDVVSEVQIPFIDDASIENAIHCWVLMLYLGFLPSQITERFKTLGTVAMRMELKDGINNCTLINDSYNSDLNSLSIAIDFLNQQKQHEKKTVILSDILQSGSNDDQLYEEVLNLVEKKEITQFIGIGEALMKQKQKFKKMKQLKTAFYPSTTVFLESVSHDEFRNESILLKGARLFEFERISKFLEQKVHQTVLEINLNALAANLTTYHSILRPETKMMAMVKAFSYGSGTFEIANLLQYHRIDYLAVAYADEGVELRKAGIALPIMVMSPEVRSFDAMIRHNLEPEIYSLSILDKFEHALVGRGKDMLSYPFPIHLKLDTGMHRLGFEEKDLDVLIQRLKNNAYLTATSIFSHLSGSDSPRHDSYSNRQIERFSAMSDKVISALGYPIFRHILNSAGILRFPEAQFEMVRLGLGLYGIDITSSLQDRLQQAGTLKTTIAQIKEVSKDDTIGYDRNWKAETNHRIATVSIGYADGYSRRFSNGKGYMLVRGLQAPVVGNVCMDMCMIDVTSIPGATEGDEVTVFGPDLPVQVLADQVGTIPYEVLTGISGRVKRVYFQE